MILKALLLILGGVLFLIMTIVSMVFMVIGLANNKPNKFFWLGSFFVSLIITITCVVVFVRKTAQTAENFSEKFEQHMDQALEKGMRDNPTYQGDTLENAQVEQIKAYLPDSLKNTVPRDFYYYLGFRDYYRLPIRYPYAIQCVDTPERGGLYNEMQVTEFDHNDNGDLSMHIEQIGSIAYDDKFLLIEFSEDEGPALNKYLLFEFDKEVKTGAKSLKKLLELAKRQGYKGPQTLTPLRSYYNGFF